MVKALRTGIYGNASVHHHNFRSTETDKFTAKFPIIPRKCVVLVNLIDRYLPDKQKALLAEQANKNAILGENQYNERAKRDPFTRLRLKHKELGQEIRFQGYRTENERVSAAVDFNNKRDHSERDTRMIHHPSWRTGAPDRFCGEMSKNGFKSDFKTATNTFPLKSHPAWAERPLKEAGQAPEIYIEGLEKLGNDLSLRTRDQQAEYDPANQFLAHTRPNIWNSTQHISQSVRTKCVDDLQNVKPKHDDFSTNHHLKFYKDNLVATKNVDKIVPFKHSQK